MKDNGYFLHLLEEKDKLKVQDIIQQVLRINCSMREVRLKSPSLELRVSIGILLYCI